MLSRLKQWSMGAIAWLKGRKYAPFKSWFLNAIVFAVVLGAGLVVMVKISDAYAFWDDDPDRGATTVQSDVFGDSFTSVKYLPQNWEPEDSLWFYNTTQGSNLMPYDFFLVLEQKDSEGEQFRSDENMNNRYRYLPRKATFANPDALPVGFVKDYYRGQNYIGFTCAACHTGQLNYNGVGYRIDGGAAMADMHTFIEDLSLALRAVTCDPSTTTGCDPEVRARFVRNVLALGNYGSEEAILRDVDKWSRRITNYYFVNHGTPPYGYARLDAFGRIYNKILEYVLDRPSIEHALSELVAEERVTQEDVDAITQAVADTDVLTGDERDHLFEEISKRLTTVQQVRLRNKLFIYPNAPVSYPYLWDIPQHDYLQWNALASNSGLGPIGRNTGEVIGVFATMNWSRGNRPTLAGLISGQGFTSTPIRFESSTDVHNLALIEDHLKNLWSPQYPRDIMPFDEERAARGKPLFAEYCSECHTEIVRDDVNRRVVSHISRLGDIGTDPKMAENGVNSEGYSGILRNKYVDVGVGSVLLNQRAPVAALLTKATLSVVATPDSDKWFGRRLFDWAYDLLFALRHNDIDSSIKRGNYNPDTTLDPFASVLGYKARSLNGIWATAPYLHNGSVPTLYDLLLPATPLPGDLPGTKYRPTEFQVGSREFDPTYVGYKSTGYQGFTFRTTSTGNSNKGHEYGTRTTSTRSALSEEDRLDLLEYLKSL